MKVIYSRTESCKKMDVKAATLSQAKTYRSVEHLFKTINMFHKSDLEQRFSPHCL